MIDDDEATIWEKYLTFWSDLHHAKRRLLEYV